MRKYIMFIASFLFSFLILYYIGQLLYGMFLLPEYTGGITAVWQAIINSTISKSNIHFWIIIFAVFLSAINDLFVSNMTYYNDIIHYFIVLTILYLIIYI